MNLKAPSVPMPGAIECVLAAHDAADRIAAAEQAATDTEREARAIADYLAKLDKPKPRFR